MNTLRVNTKRDSSINQKSEDTYIEKLVKYIPIEIVAAYTAMRALLLPDKEKVNKDILPYGEEADLYLYSVIFFGCLFLTPIYKYFSLKDDNLPTPTYQIAISFFALIIWVFAFGDFFEIKWEAYSHKLASIILIFFTLLTPLLEKVFLKTK
jgi:hypothetical protein